MCGHEAKELANDGAIFVDRETPLNTSGLLGSRRCAAKSVRPEELFSTASKVYGYREQARFFWQKRQFHAVSGCSVSSWRRYFLHPEESPKQRTEVFMHLSREFASKVRQQSNLHGRF